MNKKKRMPNGVTPVTVPPPKNWDEMSRSDKQAELYLQFLVIMISKYHGGVMEFKRDDWTEHWCNGKGVKISLIDQENLHWKIEIGEEPPKRAS